MLRQLVPPELGLGVGDSSDARNAEEHVEGHRDDLFFSAGIPPCDPESAALITPAASTIGKDFGQSSVERAKHRRAHSVPDANAWCEFACSDGSLIQSLVLRQKALVQHAFD